MKCWAAPICGLMFWAGTVCAQGLDEATIRPDSRAGLERLLSRAGFGDLQKSYALVVGVSDFAEYTDLPTGSDPIRVRDYLINEAGFDYVHILTEENVTKARLEELIVDEFRPLVGQSDRFLFYWSGHGVTLTAGAGDIGFLPISNSRQDVFSTMVAMTDISRWDRYIEAHQILYLLDSCFSGLAGATPQSDLADITREQLSGPGRHMITAGNADEQTIAIDDLGGSVFTHALLKGLRGAADSRNELGADGLISVGELQTYLGQEISRLRTRYNWQASITPQIRDLRGSEGAFFFPIPASFPTPLETRQGDETLGNGEVIPQGGDSEVIEVQRGLNELGYGPIEADGMLGFATRRALIAFQTDTGLNRSGDPDQATISALIRALVPAPDQRPVGNEASSVRPEDDETTTATMFPEITESDFTGIEMVTIQGGTYEMGTNNGRPEQGPAQTVQVAPFQVAKTEMTMGLFREYIEAEGLDFISQKVESDPTCYAWSDDNRLRRTAYAYNQLSNTTSDFPVSCVNYEDVTGFLNWLNTSVNGPPFRLLNEAEYEYLMYRTDSPTVFGPLVDLSAANVCAAANIADLATNFDWRNTSCADGSAGVATVAQYQPDLSGLYDIRGNLWEWVSDCWTPTHDAPNLPKPCETGAVRGASFDDPLTNLVRWIRQPVPAQRRQTNIGFRVARDTE